MKRQTPELDGWRIRAGRLLAPRGRKAELGRHLAERYGRTARSWETNIGQVLAGAIVPNAETLLAIDAWMKNIDGGKLVADDKIT